MTAEPLPWRTSANNEHSPSCEGERSHMGTGEKEGGGWWQIQFSGQVTYELVT